MMPNEETKSGRRFCSFEIDFSDVIPSFLTGAELNNGIYVQYVALDANSHQSSLKLSRGLHLLLQTRTFTFAARTRRIFRGW